MTRKGRMAGGWLSDDEKWKERLKEMQSQRPSKANSEDGYKETLKLPVVECDPDCLICHGNSFYITAQEIAIECPNARKKKGTG